LDLCHYFQGDAACPEDVRLLGEILANQHFVIIDRSIVIEAYRSDD